MGGTRNKGSTRPPTTSALRDFPSSRRGELDQLISSIENLGVPSSLLPDQIVAERHPRMPEDAIAMWKDGKIFIDPEYLEGTDDALWLDQQTGWSSTGSLPGLVGHEIGHQVWDRLINSPSIVTYRGKQVSVKEALRRFSQGQMGNFPSGYAESMTSMKNVLRESFAEGFTAIVTPGGTSSDYSRNLSAFLSEILPQVR